MVRDSLTKFQRMVFIGISGAVKTIPAVAMDVIVSIQQENYCQYFNDK